LPVAFTFAQRCFIRAACFALAALLIGRLTGFCTWVAAWPFGATVFALPPPRMLSNSLVNTSIRSLSVAARRSVLAERLVMDVIMSIFVSPCP